MSAATPAPMSKTQDTSRFLGAPGAEVSVLAFRGGAFDTAMYLGVIQGWLLMKRPPPSLVTGVSAGAVAAAAMAEVYQAGDGKTDLRARHEQARRLRELVLAYANAPRELLQAWLPDTYEINADRPLTPQLLPTQFEAERRERHKAVLSKFGLIKLFNTILAIDLDVSVVTRIVRNVLEFSRLKEVPDRFRRWRGYVATIASLWLIGTLHPFSCSLLLRTIVGAMVGSKHDTTGHSAAELLSIARRTIRRLRAATGRVAALLGFTAVWITPPLGSIVLGSSLIERILNGTSFVTWVSGWRYLAWAAAVDAGIALVVVVIVIGVLRSADSVAENVLRRFDLDAELGSSYDLEQFMVRLFDPSYYGTLNVNAAVDRALERSTQPQTTAASPKTLGAYRRTASMCVAPAVADLGTGALRLLGPEVSVVEALMAALAAGPFFKARTLETGGPLDYKHTFADGVNVANEPISALMDYLRSHVHEQAASVTVYTVAPFPSTGVPPDGSDFSELVDVVVRVKAIQSVQTVELERSLTDVYSALLPQRTAVTFVPDGKGTAVPYVNARLVPIDSEVRLDVNGQLLTAPNQAERSRIIFRSIAAGCRAALCQGLSEQLVANNRWSAPTVKCRAALERYWGKEKGLQLSGSDADADSAPGLPEVCAECTVTSTDSSGAPVQVAISLPLPRVALKRQYIPRRHDAPPEPWIAMALSGGVFRGVFQLGVLNALSELNVRPKLIAGSSVGSIMAAFAARLTSTREADVRRQMVRSAAATFLALDFLIPTDRFSDFIRRFTLRAGAARFSARDADLLFRRYDEQRQSFSRTARKVIAGMERLFYITPFEVRQMTEAFREEDLRKVTGLGTQFVQDFLERSGIGLELLGAEPLNLLIDHLVFKGGIDGVTPIDGRTATLEQFADVALILTATNLNQGDLKVFGMGAAGRSSREPGHVNLMEALLASSAFPAVFRPRSYAEVTPYETCGEKLVDGGVTDNLPLRAVAKFLTRASDAGRTIRRPMVDGRQVPHLVLTASLEPKWARLREDEMEQLGASWMRVRQRTAQIRHNRKADAFAKSQRDIRAIWNANVGPRDWTPLDLEVVTVKPEWLPRTFGFHPMLGFRRIKQAQSIAHGCASTMAKLAHVEEIGPNWKAADWGFSVDDILKDAVTWNPLHTGAPWTHESVLMPVANVDEQSGDPTLPGRCWFRGHATCPFFAGSDTSTRAKELHAIYLACGDERTHLSPAD